MEWWLEAKAHLQVNGANCDLIPAEKASRERKRLVEGPAGDHVVRLRQIHYVENIVADNREVQVVFVPHLMRAWTAATKSAAAVTGETPRAKSAARSPAATGSTTAAIGA